MFNGHMVGKWRKGAQPEGIEVRPLTHLDSGGGAMFLLRWQGDYGIYRTHSSWSDKHVVTHILF